MKINLPDNRGNPVEITVDKQSLEKYFTNLLTRNDTAEPRFFVCAFCSKFAFFPLESEDYMICNTCWRNSLGEDE